ncbi:hypothetical protein K3495_g2926 [Podosphaera aphanis]|nr:hypothetical protein K3495_g2926 [Podosphaera aphanis]
MGKEYFPHPAPDAAGKEDSVSVGVFSVFKTLTITAIISLILYIVLSFLVVPIWKRYRGRYSTYLPLERITSQTTSLQQRVQTAVINYLVPSSWTTQFLRNQHLASADEVSDFDEDDGEELFEVDRNRREALSLDARRDHNDEGNRLSRDLEEGFKDDSDSDNDCERNSRHGSQIGVR